MDPTVARQMWRTLEPYHGMIYFVPAAEAAYRRLGAVGRTGYFGSRAAPMGAVAPAVVAATFFNFDPRLVHAAIPSAWTVAPPAAWVDARLGAADAGLRALLGDEAVGSPEVVEAAALARQAAEAGGDGAGRPLYAGHAALAWPDEPHLVLWHAVSVLREHRGDGHVAALVGAGLDGVEALVTHGADGTVPAAVLQATRGWSDEAWSAAVERLEARGWWRDGAPTEAGTAARREVEARTDELALAPWLALGEDRARRLRELVRPASRAIAASGVFAAPPAPS